MAIAIHIRPPASSHSSPVVPFGSAELPYSFFLLPTFRPTFLFPLPCPLATRGEHWEPRARKTTDPLLHLVRSRPESVYPVAAWEADWKCKANCSRVAKVCACVEAAVVGEFARLSRYVARVWAMLITTGRIASPLFLTNELTGKSSIFERESHVSLTWWTTRYTRTDHKNHPVWSQKRSAFLSVL